MKPTRSLEKVKVVNIEKQSCNPLDVIIYLFKKNFINKIESSIVKMGLEGRGIQERAASFHFICILIKWILQICMLHAKPLRESMNAVGFADLFTSLHISNAQIKSFRLHLIQRILQICVLRTKPLRELSTDGFVRNC